MCAQTLIEAGLTVLMLDGGIEEAPPPAIDATTLYDYKVATNGDEFMPDLQSSLKWKQTSAAEQLTPPRRYVLAQTEKWLPASTSGFQLMESLAYGGLGAAWGLGCYRFTDEELGLCGLPAVEMSKAYETIAQRIGISYSPDDIAAFVMGKVNSLQPSIAIDENSKAILLKYELQKKRFQNKGFYIGKPPMALLTEAIGQRKATDYSNLDFYANRGLSAWRPSVTLDKLRKHPAFHYEGKRVVKTFLEKNGLVEVTAIRMQDLSITAYRAKKLVIACGATGTARIVARSFSFDNPRLSLLCNPYGYIVALQTSRLGKVSSPKRTSTAQLAIIQKSEMAGEDGMASLYAYDALPMSNVLKQIPLGFTDGRVIMQYLLPAIVIAGVHHPDRYTDQKFIRLVRNDNSPTGDALEILFGLSTEEQENVRHRTHQYRSFLRKVGCIPIKTVQPPLGSSIHYAGTLPFDYGGAPLTTHPDGRLANTNHVFIADSSPFRFLPAKGLTFTIMANAHRTALQLLKNE